MYASFRVSRCICSSLPSWEISSMSYLYCHHLICSNRLPRRLHTSRRAYRQSSSLCLFFSFTQLCHRCVRYLLGSGGTLMFDVTIVTQSLFYRHRPPLHLRGRRSSVRARNHMEEEEGLLGAGTSGAGDPTTPSRRRLVEGESSLES